MKDPGSVFVCVIITAKFDGSKMQTNNNVDREGMTMFRREIVSLRFQKMENYNVTKYFFALKQ